MDVTEALKAHIREVPDFPIDGISFKDISPVFLNPHLMQQCEEALADRWKGQGVTKVLGVDSRGFLFGPRVAQLLDAGFVMVRKKGKLPPETVSVSYDLEYGQAEIESSTTALVAGDRVIIHDDLLATGGTARAAAQLAKKLGAEVVGFSFIINLDFLHGKDKLKAFSTAIHALIDFES